MEIVPDSLAWRDSYKLLVGAIVPRPIAFVSTVDKQGNRNLAPFSFFNGVCPSPFIVSFAVMLRGSDGQTKDTLRNIVDTGEYVINVVTEDIVADMNLTAPEFPEHVDEFEQSGLTAVASNRVKPWRVLESPINMECELHSVIPFGDEPGAGSLVLGKVVHMHVRDDVYFDGKINIEKLRPVARLAGDEYTRVTDRFHLPRPTLPDEFRR